MGDKLRVQILTSLNQFSLDELVQIKKEIQMIRNKPPQIDPEVNSHDAFKFTNRSRYEGDDIFLRVYLERIDNNGFKYKAEVRGARGGDKSSRLLSSAWYTSQDFQRTPVKSN